MIHIVSSWIITIVYNARFLIPPEHHFSLSPHFGVLLQNERSDYFSVLREIKSSFIELLYEIYND